MLSSLSGFCLSIFSCIFPILDLFFLMDLVYFVVFFLYDWLFCCVSSNSIFCFLWILYILFLSSNFFSHAFSIQVLHWKLQSWFSIRSCEIQPLLLRFIQKNNINYGFQLLIVEICNQIDFDKATLNTIANTYKKTMILLFPLHCFYFLGLRICMFETDGLIQGRIVIKFILTKRRWLWPQRHKKLQWYDFLCIAFTC